MPNQIFYHPDVQRDLSRLSGNIKIRIRRAIEERLLKDPIAYGEPLKRTLKGYRKLRVGDYRIIYKLEGTNIIILTIGHRKEAYEKIHLRL
jgi:mRNA interferase RelE/StbE